MKKIIIFLITIAIFSLISIKNVSATSFYQAEYIPDTWFNKKNPEDGLVYYNQARVIRESNTNVHAYCLEPFTLIIDNEEYPNQSVTHPNYTQEQLEKISLIAHFGYKYGNFSTTHWYAAAQMMIWKITRPDVYFYYSTYKKGTPADILVNETKAIQNLVDRYYINTSFNNQTITIPANIEQTLTDTNNILETYKTNSPYVTIANNILKTKALNPGTYEIVLEKESIKHNSPALFYYSNNNQDLIKVGDPQKKINTITLNVIETSITINKIDKDTKTSNPQGEADLINTKFSLFKEDNTHITDIALTNTTSTKLTNLPLGKYYLKELETGKGYKINEKKYYFTISKEKPNITIDIENEVIKGTLKIYKEYGYNNIFNPEENISFNIYNQNNELIKTITTNKLGIAEIELPYGKYDLIQLTTTEGYQKIKPISFEISEDKVIIEKNFKNYKIYVPNTKKESLISKIINYIKDILCIKKYFL